MVYKIVSWFVFRVRKKYPQEKHELLIINDAVRNSAFQNELL